MTNFWLSLADARRIDWDAVAARLPFAEAMQSCQQDAIYHGEGDVWTHTRMVVEQLLAARASAGIPDADWPALFLAALLHDIAKPETRAEQYDAASGRIRVTHHHHARRGAVMAWTVLSQAGLAHPLRETVFHLIEWHQRVFFMTQAKHSDTDIVRFSMRAPWRSLLALGEADTRGRINPDIALTLANLAHLRRSVVALRCLDAPAMFASAQARVWSCAERGRARSFDPPTPAGSRVIVHVGVPAPRAAGPVQHLVNGSDQAAMTAALAHLGAKRAFTWSAPHLTRAARVRSIGLCLAHDAEVELHVVDTAAGFEPPSPDEAHRLVWV